MAGGQADCETCQMLARRSAAALTKPHGGTLVFLWLLFVTAMHWDVEH